MGRKRKGGKGKKKGVNLLLSRLPEIGVKFGRGWSVGHKTQGNSTDVRGTTARIEGGMLKSQDLLG